MRRSATLISLTFVLWLISSFAGCGGGGGGNDVAPPPPETVTISIAAGSSRVWVGQTLQFSAHVEGSTNQAVTWSLEGTGCTGDVCGSINTNGLYTAPAALTVADLIVRGTAVADPTKSATAPLLLLAPALDRLQGQYAFLLRGFMSNGEFMHMGGVFTADGNGNVGGVLDAVLHDTVLRQQAFSGGYSLSTENRGHLTMGPAGSSYVFSFVLNAAGEKGYLIAFDTTNARTAGVLFKQNLNAFYTGSLVGDYAFALTGDVGLVGRVSLDGSGNFSGNVPFMNGGNWVMYGLQASGNYQVAANGRGEANLYLNSSPALCSVYVIDANTMLWLSLDPQGGGWGRFSGEVLRQSDGPFDDRALNGTYILGMNGAIYQSSNTHSRVGRLVLDGTGLITGSYDYNDHGTVQLNVQVTTSGGASYYSISSEGFLDGDLDNRTFHGVVVSPDRALLMTEYAFDAYGFLAGTLERQTGGPFNNGSLAGTLSYGNLSFSSNAAPLLQCGVAQVDGNGHLNMVEDENSFGQPAADAQAAINYSESAEGRFTAETMVGYQVSPTKLVIFSADPQNSAPQLLEARP